MYYFPLGELKTDRYKLSEKYKLVELVNGIYRLTKKARKYYDRVSYIKYLRGDIEKPIRIDLKNTESFPKTAKPQQTDPLEFKNPECQQIISEILDL